MVAAAGKLNAMDAPLLPLVSEPDRLALPVKLHVHATEPPRLVTVTLEPGLPFVSPLSVYEYVPGAGVYDPPPLRPTKS